MVVPPIHLHSKASKTLETFPTLPLFQTTFSCQLFFPEEFEVPFKPVMALPMLCNPSQVQVWSSPAFCASVLNMNHYPAELDQLLPSRWCKIHCTEQPGQTLQTPATKAHKYILLTSKVFRIFKDKESGFKNTKPKTTKKLISDTGISFLIISFQYLFSKETYIKKKQILILFLQYDQ